MSGEKILAATLADEKDGPPFWFAAISSEPDRWISVNRKPEPDDLEDVRALFEPRRNPERKSVTLYMTIARRYLASVGAEFLEE